MYLSLHLSSLCSLIVVWYTALYIAALENHVKTVEILLDRGADLEATDMVLSIYI